MKQKAIKQDFGTNLKILALLLVVASVFFVSSGGLMTVMAIDETSEPEWDKPGSIRLNKTATPAENDNEWRIDLTIEGKNYPTSTDVVLVIDTSGSMNYDMTGSTKASSGSRRIDYTKKAAESFVDNIITDNTSETHRIAIVTFAKNSSAKCSLTNNTSTLKTCISNLSADGGTNMQAGLYEAQKILESSSAQNKFIVILGDGGPTYCNKITAVSGITVKHTTSDNHTEHTAEFSDDYTITFSNSGEVVGAGNTSTYNNLYTVKCDTCNKNIGVLNDVIVPTEYQASLAKSQGIKIYSIAFGADSTGEQTLKNISSNTSDNATFYTQIPANTNTATIQTLLNSTFENIAANILSAATDGVVTDPMGEMFDIIAPNGADDITITIINSADNSIEQTYKGSENNLVTIEGDTLKWNVGTVPDGKIMKMSYYVRIKDTAESGVQYPTNKETYFEYKNYLNENAVKKFPIPTACISTGKIQVYCYLSDSNGQPLDENGQSVESVTDSYILKNYSYSVNDSSNLPLGKTYTINADIISGAVFVGSYIEDSAITDSTSVSVELTKQSSEQNVYFAYTMTNGTLTIQKTGDVLDNESSVFKIEASDGSVFYETIQGSGSKVFSNLQVGTKYTITEITDWSWKYELQGENAKTVCISVDGNTVSFENKGTSDYLSYESIVSNKFDCGKVS